MITSLALACQLAVAMPGAVLVRGPTATTRVPLEATPTGAAVRIDRLAPAIPMVARHLTSGEWSITLAGVDVRLSPGLPFARSGTTVVPLAAAPIGRRGVLIVPLEVLSEVLPRLAPAMHWDATRRELRLTTPADSAIPVSGDAPIRVPARRPGHAVRRRVVVVDAGHGGPDNGMSGPIGASPRWTVYEKDITLAVSKKLATALRDRGFEVVMTRTTDTLIALSDRGRIANEHHGDVFVSVHVNAANPNWHDPGAARGFETYFLSEAKTEDAKRVEEMENASVRFETDVQTQKSDPLSYIMNDMAQNEHLRESSELAALIQQHLGTIEPGPSRGVKQAGFRVLVTAYMPAVLVEIGFGTNRDDARFITNGGDQRQIASAIADAVVEYLDHYQQRLGTTPATSP